MNALLFICLLFCAASASRDISSASLSNGSTFASDAVHTVKEGFEIKKEIDNIRNRKKNKGKNRSRRSFNPVNTVYKAEALLDSLLQSYVIRPLTSGTFVEGTVRDYAILNTPRGKAVFGSLDGDLNQSFRSMIDDAYTGDIISCRIPSSRVAEHYMMVVNKNIIEVGVVGGKSAHQGVIMVDGITNSSYVNSTECLYHENRVISKAVDIDAKKGGSAEIERKLVEIVDRINCTTSGKNSGRFYYDVMSCNCQDLVLYWAYGYVENKNCLSGFLNGCSTYLTYTYDQLLSYVDDVSSGEEGMMSAEETLTDAIRVMLPFP